MSINNRLKKNYKHLSKWARKNQIDSYRLYDRDIPEYPFAIDIYGENCVIFYYQDQIDNTKDFQWPHTKEALLELGFKNTNLYLKIRKKQKGIKQYDKLTDKKKYEIIREHQAIFKINLSDYLDSGIFLDHRPLRQIIYKESINKSFLNLFCYTASVSVFAALGGANKVCSVDMSKQYIEWAKENFHLNKLNSESFTFVCENTFDFLNGTHEKYDLIFLDPPTFSNSKKMHHDFEIERDQDRLLKMTMKKLNRNGKLYFSTNKTNFKLNQSIIDKYHVKNITNLSIPQDFRNKKIHQLYLITESQTTL